MYKIYHCYVVTLIRCYFFFILREIKLMNAFVIRMFYSQRNNFDVFYIVEYKNLHLHVCLKCKQNVSWSIFVALRTLLVYTGLLYLLPGYMKFTKYISLQRAALANTTHTARITLITSYNFRQIFERLLIE